MKFEAPRIEPLGESAFLVRVGDDVSVETNAATIALAKLLTKALPLRVEVVPAFASVGVFFDSATDERASVEATISGTLEAPQSATGSKEAKPRTFKIPVSYDGPDIDAAASALGIGRKQLIKLHTEPVYTVMMLGFSPGFAYLGPLPQKLVLPRRPEPRPRVPPGSVAMAGAQTAIYPLDTPGGWHLIGRTKLVMFDPLRAEPALLRSGDRVVFTKQ